MKAGGNLSIVIAILIFGLIVLIHEGGHFFFAKVNGIAVEEFAIGMGPKIIGKEVKGTLFSVRALPFGGFCKVLGEDEEVNEEGSYSSKSVWAKMQLVFGGPLFNILLALIFAYIYISLSTVGETTVSTVIDNSPAQEAGLMPGDKIIEIDGKHIISYNEIQIYINERKGKAINLVYERDGNDYPVILTPKYVEDDGIYEIGIGTKRFKTTGFIETAKYSLIEIAFWIKMVFYGLYMIFTGGVSANDIAGPVGIVSAVSEGYKESAKIGFESIIRTISFFITLLSSNLAMMNLLPIPALDGGRLMFLIVEAIRRKPLDQEKEGMIHFVGYVILMLLMVVILFNDIRKLF